MLFPFVFFTTIFDCWHIILESSPICVRPVRARPGALVKSIRIHECLAIAVQQISLYFTKCSLAFRLGEGGVSNFSNNSYIFSGVFWGGRAGFTRTIQIALQSRVNRANILRRIRVLHNSSTTTVL